MSNHATTSKPAASKPAVPVAACCAAACVLLTANAAFAHPLEPLRGLPTLGAYFKLGVEHILTGYDHLLFLAGLVVAAQRVRDVLWAISAFTVAHSVTLALSMFGVLAPNPLVIEVLIALSIAYVGFDNLRTRGAPVGRYWLTLGFGLVHGFGFASALHEIGLPQSRELAALALFNVGVESGQLLVLAPCVAFVWSMRKPAPTRLWMHRGVNAVLVVVGLAWTLQRALLPAPATAVLAADSRPDATRSAPAARPSIAVDERLLSWAEPLCDAFQTLPRQRRAACAGERTGALLTAQCTRLLDASIRSGGITFEPDQAKRCVSALEDRYRGCAWTAARALPPVAECSSLLQGSKAVGESCHSSLECSARLHCQGVGPLDAGVCAAAAPTGARCELALDPLAAYVASDASARPECAGSCMRGRCVDAEHAAL